MKSSVSPDKIEPELLEAWNQQEHADEVKAALFNLVVFIPEPARVEYALRICQVVTRKYPCRLILLTDDQESDKDYLQTQISVEFIGEGSHLLSCDQIEFRYSGREKRKIPSLILPHLVTDLPVYLLWLGQPDGNADLFNFMQKIASRVIFDPDYTELLPKFSRDLLTVLPQFSAGVSDMSWASTDGWRQVIASALNTPRRIEAFNNLTWARITYTAHETTYRRDPQMQANYLQGWIAAQMGWKFCCIEKEQNTTRVRYDTGRGEVEIHLVSEWRPDMELGTILSVEAASSDQWRFEFVKDQSGQYVRFKLWTPERCDLPHTLYLPHPGKDRVLAHELFQEGTSAHYQKMLELVAGIERTL